MGHTLLCGRFNLTGVVPGVSFYLQTRKGQEFFRGKPKIGLGKLKTGETLDLGDRTMESALVPRLSLGTRGRSGPKICQKK